MQAKPVALSKTREAFLKLRQESTMTGQYRNCLIYGPSGAGKTSFVASAAADERTAPTLMLDFEGGNTSAQGFGADIVRIRTWDDYSTVYNYLANGGHNDYRSLSIDSVTETHVGALLHIVDTEVIKDDRRKDDTLLEQQDYGRAMVWLRRFLRRFRDLPMHVFITALPRTDIDPGEGQVIKPALFGQMANEIIAMFDLNAYLTVKTLKNADPMNDKDKVIQRIMYLQNQTKMRVKTRTPLGVTVPDKIVIPLNTGVTTLFDALHVAYLEKGSSK